MVLGLWPKKLHTSPLLIIKPEATDKFEAQEGWIPLEIGNAFQPLPRLPSNPYEASYLQ